MPPHKRLHGTEDTALGLFPLQIKHEVDVLPHLRPAEVTATAAAASPLMMNEPRAFAMQRER